MPQSCILQSKGASILPPPLLALQREVSRGVKGTGGNKRGSGQKAELVLQFSCVKRLLTTGWAPFRGRRFPKAIREPAAGAGPRAGCNRSPFRTAAALGPGSVRPLVSCRRVTQLLRLSLVLPLSFFLQPSAGFLAPLVFTPPSSFLSS